MTEERVEKTLAELVAEQMRFRNLRPESIMDRSDLANRMSTGSPANYDHKDVGLILDGGLPTLRALNDLLRVFKRGVRVLSAEDEHGIKQAYGILAQVPSQEERRRDSAESESKKENSKKEEKEEKESAPAASVNTFTPRLCLQSAKEGNMDFPQIVRMHRRLNGRHQTQYGEEIGAYRKGTNEGVSGTTVSRWEKGGHIGTREDQTELAIAWVHYFQSWFPESEHLTGNDFNDMVKLARDMLVTKEALDEMLTAAVRIDNVSHEDENKGHQRPTLRDVLYGIMALKEVTDADKYAETITFKKNGRPRKLGGGAFRRHLNGGKVNENEVIEAIAADVGWDLLQTVDFFLLCKGASFDYDPTALTEVVNGEKEISALREQRGLTTIDFGYAVIHIAEANNQLAYPEEALSRHRVARIEDNNKIPNHLMPSALTIYGIPDDDPNLKTFLLNHTDHSRVRRPAGASKQTGIGM